VTDKQGEDGDKETQASSGRRHRQTEATGLAAFSEIPLVLLRLLPLIFFSSVQLGHGVHRLLLPYQRADAPG